MMGSVKIALVGQHGPGLAQQAGRHGTQGLGLGLAPLEQALVEGRARGVGPAGRPGPDVEQAAQTPIAELTQPGLAAHAAARFVVARAEAGVGHGLPPAGKGAQARPGQQQGQGDARAHAGDGLQALVVGPALGLGIIGQAFFQFRYLLVQAGQLGLQGLGADRVGPRRLAQGVLVVAQGRALALEQVEQGLALLQLRQPYGTGLMQGRGEDAPELAQQLRIRAVGLAAPQLALGEAAHLQGVDHAHGPAGLVQGRQQAQAVGAGGLEYAHGPLGQRRQQGRVAGRRLGQVLHPAGQ
nr:hypothetical protein [Tanacetum cinerariifolium]